MRRTAIIAIALFVGTAALDAHEAHKPRIGAPNQQTPSGAPENWGTYCVTELAPLFREALALYQTNNQMLAQPYAKNFSSKPQKNTKKPNIAPLVLPKIPMTWTCPYFTGHSGGCSLS